MSLLTNAVESIEAGVRQWKEGTRPSLLSAVRNLHAGVLLLFKEALLRKSPDGTNEVLIKARILPVLGDDGDIKFVGVGKKTVDTQQIRDRFESLGIQADWKALEQIATVRNDVEHYYTTVTQHSLSSVIASAFVLIRTFATKELEENPRELFGQETWDTMLRTSELHAAERGECDTAVAEVSWESETLQRGVRELICLKCGSDLLYPTGGDSFYEVSLVCRSCGAEREPLSFIPSALEKALEWESYSAAKDGADDPLAECPDCHKSTFVIPEGRCAYCGESASQTCARCSHAIPSSEMGSSPLCGYCDHMMSKDD